MLRALRVVQTNTGADFINELRVGPAGPPGASTRNHTRGAFEMRSTANWCGEALRPGQFVEVAFNVLEPADSVEIQTAPN